MRPGNRSPSATQAFSTGSAISSRTRIDFAKDQVSVDATWSRDEVRIVVTDDGDGFPLDVLEQLGEPFVTTRPATTIDR